MVEKLKAAAFFAAGALVVSVGGGLAYAAIPNSTTGVITGCYVTSGANAGKLRVIDAQGGAVCNTSETSLRWNQKGLIFRGAWTNSTAYAVGDVVTKAGSSWFALQANTNVDPSTHPATWALLAKKGVDGAPGVPGPPGPSGPKGVGSVFYVFTSAFDQWAPVTPAFTAAANATCLVTSSAQLIPAQGEPASTVYMRNSVRRDGADNNDGTFGQYMYSDGTTAYQPSISRSSVFSIVAGQSVQFGAYFGSGGSFEGSQVNIQTTYACS
jgi:hypothetical protein